jgi:hypothetical protein
MAISITPTEYALYSEAIVYFEDNSCITDTEELAIESLTLKIIALLEKE